MASNGFWRAALAALTVAVFSAAAASAQRFEGRHFVGEGDVEYVQLLDVARRMFEPDPEYPNLAMLYTPAWNGLVKGPTWGGWWVHGSYGATYAALPMLQEPYLTFLQNSQDLWFDQMGDGVREGQRGWVAPDGCLCDAAAPGWIYYKNGEGRVELHDWALEPTAAAIVLQAELLLIGRDAAAIAKYLPKLERAAEFIESRRDPEKNLFLAGPGANFVAPSFAGWKRPDGNFEPSYLTGLSITYIAALDRMIELEKLAGNSAKAVLYEGRRDLARKGLAELTAPEGYFIKSLDPDGTKHGAWGQPQHGYFEAVCNHDAICFRIADDDQAMKIYNKIASIGELRRHELIVSNHPSLDDMYELPQGLWEHGRWVNGGHWASCEARMILAYSRLGKHDDARKSMKRLAGFAQQFRLDDPRVNFGAEVSQPNEPINCVYDCWGVPAAMIRGLFEYLYRADSLVILPHVPPGVSSLEQRFPIRFGAKRIYLSTLGSGAITEVTINGQPHPGFDAKSVTLPYSQLPDEARIAILFGGMKPKPATPQAAASETPKPEAKPEPSLQTLAGSVFPVVSSNDLPLRLGAAQDGTCRFVGEMDYCRIHNQSLRPEDIAEIADAKGKRKEQESSLVGYWKFQLQRKENFFPNAKTSGSTAPAARAVGEVNVVDAPTGQAARLAGKGYLEIASEAYLKPIQKLTLAAWVKPGKIASTGSRLFDKYHAGTTSGYALELLPGGKLRLLCDWGALSADAALKPDEWTHVAATIDDDGSLAIYVGGKQVAVQKLPGSPTLIALEARAARAKRFAEKLAAASLGGVYEAGHARLAALYFDVCRERMKRLTEGKLNRLSGGSQLAADRWYFETATRLCEGLEKTLDAHAKSKSAEQQQLHKLWSETKP